MNHPVIDDAALRTPLEAAHTYAAQGFAVFPLASVHDGRCTCGQTCSSPGKHPRIRHGLHEATTDHARIERWFKRWPRANVGVRTGEPSGLVVLDVDPAHGGLSSLRHLIQSYQPILPTLTVSTGSDGLHFYFRHPGELLRNSAGRLGRGLDVRGDGGYVVAPPSNHVSGGRYTWCAAGELAPLPEWLHNLVREPKIERAPRPRSLRQEDATAWANAALRNEIGTLQAAKAGERNNALNRSAFSLGQLVGGGALEHEETAAKLIATGMSIGLSERECTATVSSGLVAGIKHPREARPTGRGVDIAS